MRLLALLLLTLVPSWAVAQSEIEPPPCFPMINGVHPLSPRILTGEVGEHLYWFCSPRGGALTVHGFSWPRGKRAETALRAAHAAVLTASAKVTAAQNAYRAAMSFDCADVPADEVSDRRRLCDERLRMAHAAGPEWHRELATETAP